MHAHTFIVISMRLAEVGRNSLVPTLLFGDKSLGNFTTWHLCSVISTAVMQWFSVTPTSSRINCLVKKRAW